MDKRGTRTKDERLMFKSKENVKKYILNLDKLLKADMESKSSIKVIK